MALLNCTASTAPATVTVSENHAGFQDGIDSHVATDLHLYFLLHEFPKAGLLYHNRVNAGFHHTERILAGLIGLFAGFPPSAVVPERDFAPATTD